MILPLASSHAPFLKSFSCGHADLESFLTDDALDLQEQGMARTYIYVTSAIGTAPAIVGSGIKFGEGVVVGDIVVTGYVSLLTDAVELQTRERSKLALPSQGVPVVPAVKIGRLAVMSARQRGEARVGTALVRHAHQLAYSLSGTVGCRLLTVDAKHGSVEFYEKLGFVPNKVANADRRKRAEEREQKRADREDREAEPVNDLPVSMRLDLEPPRPWLDE